MPVNPFSLNDLPGHVLCTNSGWAPFSTHNPAHTLEVALPTPQAPHQPYPKCATMDEMALSLLFARSQKKDEKSRSSA
jgi:hypothetical protein